MAGRQPGLAAGHGAATHDGSTDASGVRHGVGLGRRWLAAGRRGPGVVATSERGAWCLLCGWRELALVGGLPCHGRARAGWSGLGPDRLACAGQAGAELAFGSVWRSGAGRCALGGAATADAGADGGCGTRGACLLAEHGAHSIRGRQAPRRALASRGPHPALARAHDTTIRRCVAGACSAVLGAPVHRRAAALGRAVARGHAPACAR